MKRLLGQHGRLAAFCQCKSKSFQSSLRRLKLLESSDLPKLCSRQAGDGVQLKYLLSDEACESLKQIANVTSGGRAQVKLWAHHVACRASKIHLLSLSVHRALRKPSVAISISAMNTFVCNSTLPSLACIE